MERAAYAVALWLACWPLPAQPQGNPPQKAVIEGAVVNAATGEPLKKARVFLQRLEGREGAFAVTDASGRFSLRDVEPGRYRLSVDRQGYVRQECAQRGSNRSGGLLAIEHGQHVRDLVIRLTPTAVVTGRVVDEDSEPVANVRVDALRYAYRDGQRQLTPHGSAQTNDLGEYRIFNLPPGRYYIRAAYSRGMRVPMGPPAPEDGYAPTYYPATNAPGQAVPVDAAAGRETRAIDISLLPTRLVRVRGRLVMAEGTAPPQRGMVNLTPREGGVGFFSQIHGYTRGPQGHFEIPNAIPGSYFLVAEFQQDGRRYSARQSLDVGETDIDGITLVLKPGMQLAGQVRVEGESSINLADVVVFLQPQGMAPARGGGRVKPDGSFVIEDVAPGAYHLNLFGPLEDFYLKAARFGPDDVLEAEIDLSRGGPGNLELMLGPGAARIEGVVMDEGQRPVAGAHVVLVPQGLRRGIARFYKYVPTDQNGRFFLRGIVPGDYRLFAWEDIEAGAYQDPEFLRPFENRGETRRVELGASLSVQLRLIR